MSRQPFSSPLFSLSASHQRSKYSLHKSAVSTGDAAISVTVKWEDDTETTVSFTVYDSSFHLAEINGEARKLVNKRDVEKLIEDMTALLKK